MLLREVLDQPRLKLALLTGVEGREAPVTRVYVTDLPDPSRYLAGGEVVLTGLMWRRGPEDSEVFVAACAAGKVTAIGAGDAVFGSIPADLVEACARHGIPLFEVPVEVSFREIVDAVNPSLWAQRASGLATVLGRQRGLVAAMAAGARLADLLPPVAADLGLACWVFSPTGRPIAGTEAAPPGGELARAFLAATRLPRTAGDGRYALVGVPGRPEHRLASWFVAFEADPEAPSGLPDGAEELVSLVALERAQLDEVVRVERRLADSLGRQLATGAGAADLRAGALSCGLEPESTFVAVVAALTGLRTPPDLTVAVLEEALRAVSAHAAVTPLPDQAVLGLVTAPPGVDVPAALRAAVDALTPGLGTGRLAIGVSAPAVGVATLPGAVAEARHAHRSAHGRTAVVCSTELASHQLLLARVPADAREAFRERLLGPLVAYDQAHDADLVRTLAEFLECGGSWSRCAERLHVHVNTLRYRISRVEALTGRDLGRFEDRVDFFLALRLSR
ncbi:PucR family transcriptional regulator ligand-binding domain-containing protein [Phytohabitans sp. ZYX-F-186]|uniref:PucR family transcriptional regulator ligand-binding domain-containing protein n=1 Tax=Phytohabitans maris TaxID=3071409 RepID=A0ABU0ZQG5_9ACTN|nr:PucR family transcriptional regulator ligand-binding domain-containing protein [Phytohabitans sp. ZYX-F-186]MDQ7909267.1 PucR family transcriptional regulator ligand-binding domain-containing protein [Phytohabitans sp. ZYX-F-186]